jgi:hypothetical protein
MTRRITKEELEKLFDKLHPREGFVDSGVYGTCKRWWVMGALESRKQK